MKYPIAIEPGSDTAAYGVIVPDLPGCYSAGDTLEDALANVEDAILLYLEDLADEGKTLIDPSALGDLVKKREYKGWTFAIANVDLSKLSEKAVRVNITVPDRLLKAIDKYVAEHDETRSGFLARAAMKAMAA